ncbi:MAG: hypothetical protein ACOCVA_04885 [Prolixibacteraceae bacterium]
MEKDVVYVLGTGSAWKNNEIRFSLRSIQKNLKGYRNVFIVGELPGFLKNVIHIPAKDIFEPGKNADGNIITKVLAACNHPDLSDDFLFINDDHLVIKPINVENVPPLHKGDMTTFPPKYWKLNHWRGRLERTMKILQKRGLSTLHFDCHTPILFNKHRFPEIVKQFDYQNDIGYTMKSLYGNVEYPDGPFLTDQKKTVFKNYSLEDLKTRLSAPTFMSFNDDGLNKPLKWWLISNFPSKSKYENNQADDVMFDLYFWQLNGKAFDRGVEIFEENFKHPNLLRLLKMGETPVLRDKLNYKLMKYIREL